MKSVLIRSFSGAHFPAFGLNTDKYFVSLCIQYDCGKIQTRKTPSTDTFHAAIPEVNSEPCQTSNITRFLISNTFISNARLKLAKKSPKQMLSNTLKLIFLHLKIIHILYLRYQPRTIGQILKNKQKNKCLCIHEFMRLMKMKMKMKMKKRSHRYDINIPRSRHRHKYSKY